MKTVEITDEMNPHEVVASLEGIVGNPERLLDLAMALIWNDMIKRGVTILLTCPENDQQLQLALIGGIGNQLQNIINVQQQIHQQINYIPKQKPN